MAATFIVRLVREKVVSERLKCRIRTKDNDKDCPYFKINNRVFKLTMKRHTVAFLSMSSSEMSADIVFHDNELIVTPAITESLPIESFVCSLVFIVLFYIALSRSFSLLLPFLFCSFFSRRFFMLSKSRVSFYIFFTFRESVPILLNIKQSISQGNKYKTNRICTALKYTFIMTNTIKVIALKFNGQLVQISNDETFTHTH